MSLKEACGLSNAIEKILHNNLKKRETIQKRSDIVEQVKLASSVICPLRRLLRRAKVVARNRNWTTAMIRNQVENECRVLIAAAC